VKPKDSETIETAEAGCAYMLALPKYVERHNAWQHAARIEPPGTQRRMTALQCVKKLPLEETQ